MQPEIFENLDDEYFERARRNMVFNQLIPGGISDEAIINAMLKVPRHDFIKSQYDQVGYSDGILPVEDVGSSARDSSRYLLPPLVFAKMLQAGGINSESVVLDVGCNTGYSSVVIACIAKKVVAIDADKRLLKIALDQVPIIETVNNLTFSSVMNFEKLGIDTKFDLIFINGILMDIPRFIKEHLRESSKLMVIEKRNHFAQAIKYTRSDNKLLREELFDVDADCRLNIYVELK